MHRTVLFGCATALLAQLATAQFGSPVASRFYDHDGHSGTTRNIYMGGNSGYIRVDVADTLGIPLKDQSYVWAFYQAGNVVAFPGSDTFHSFEFRSGDGAGVLYANVPYDICYSPRLGATNYSYALNPGAYVLRVWVGATADMKIKPDLPPTGFANVCDVPVIVQKPEIIIDIPNHNSLTCQSDILVKILQPDAAPYDRLLVISGSDGLQPQQTVATLLAGSHQVAIPVHVDYPVGRLSVAASVNDGSALGGDDSNPGVEIYWSQFAVSQKIVDSLSVATWKLAGPPESPKSGHLKGENQNPPADGDHGPDTKCVSKGGEDPNPGGFPDFLVCGSCGGGIPVSCQNVVPGTHVGLVTEAECSSAGSVVGGGGRRGYMAKPSSHCVVVTKDVQVKGYSLVGAETKDCGFIGISWENIFIGWDLDDAPCCHFAITNDNPTTVQVKTCTTVET